MNRIYTGAGLVALSLGLGGCFVAAPIDDPYYGSSYDYDPPPAVVVQRPYYGWRGPRVEVERHYVVENDRVIRHARPYTGRSKRYDGDRHRRWYDNDDRRHRHDDDD